MLNFPNFAASAQYSLHTPKRNIMNIPNITFCAMSSS